MYRDFQARNIMLDASGHPYFIDYQGGRKGPYYYDLASFLWQASAKYPHKLRRELTYEYYNSLKNYTEVPSVRHFVERLSLFVLFRTLQVLGAYGFRGYFERKKHFIDSIPPAIQNLREMLNLNVFTYPYLMDVLKRLTELPRFASIEEPALSRADGLKVSDSKVFAAHPSDGPATFSKYDNKGPLVVRVYSFSYHKGIPEDESGNGGGYVFDCRSTHNPGRYEPYKKLTGLGATYGELKAHRNSIIIEPNKPVISGKCKDPKHGKDNLFGVFDGVYADDIVAYMERSIKQNKYFKILTTPESFHKVQEAFEEMDMDIRYNSFLLFDECHKIVKDSGFRPDITLPMDLFFECEQKALVSATPIEFTDPRFEEQKFQTITIKPTFDYVKGMNLHATNNLLQAAKEVFAGLKGNCFVFCNSTDTIYSLMQQLDLLDESAVFCSEKSVEKLKGLKFENVSDIWDKDIMRRYNWLTSRFYNAVDIELEEKPTILLLTDCYFADYTAFDPNTDTIQCVGRFRNGVSSIHHISNTNRNFMVRSKEELKGRISCWKDVYDMLQNYYDYATTVSAKDAYGTVLTSLPYAEMLDEKGRTKYFKIDNYINTELVKGYYNCPDNLHEAYKNCDAFTINNYSILDYKLGDYERLQRSNKSNSIKEKRKIMVQQLELLGECQTEMEYQFKRDLEQADSFIVEAYNKIGKKEIERLKYNRKKIKEAMIIADYHAKVTGTEVSQMIYNSFETGKWYSRKFIKEEISRIFKLFGIVPKKAVTSHTILDFFHAVESKRKNIKGYQLTMRKGI